MPRLIQAFFQGSNTMTQPRNVYGLQINELEQALMTVKNGVSQLLGLFTDVTKNQVCNSLHNWLGASADA